MPLCTLHLLSLTSTITIPSFLSSLRDASLTPIVQSKVIRWMILPKALSTVSLLAHNIHWELLILLPGTSPLPSSVTSKLAAQWHVIVGVPSRLLKDFHTKNSRLLNPPAGSVKPAEQPDEAQARSTQNLELTPELASWISSLPPAQKNHPISMLNLLSFVPGKKEEYLKYGAAFAKSIGSRHGGEAKIVGNVIHQFDKMKGEEGASASGPSASGLMVEDEAVNKSTNAKSDTNKGASASGAPASGLMIEAESPTKSTSLAEQDNGARWDEIAIAHYPSLQHFAAMAGSNDYQDVNKKFRVGALMDTFILCTMEVGDDGELAGGRRGNAKL
jgi:hypothetical protein